jgi:branched-subunit amino acid transport protein
MNAMTVPNQTDGWTLLACVGLGLVTLLTRGAFILFDKAWELPAWLQRGLHYAPIAALSAVIVPELFMTQGVLMTSVLDARWMGAVAAAIWYFKRGGVLGTIVSGMVVYLPLHIGLGW